jgi:hypothetical protein
MHITEFVSTPVRSSKSLRIVRRTNNGNGLKACGRQEQGSSDGNLTQRWRGCSDSGLYSQAAGDSIELASGRECE